MQFNFALSLLVTVVVVPLYCAFPLVGWTAPFLYADLSWFAHWIWRAIQFCRKRSRCCRDPVTIGIIFVVGIPWELVLAELFGGTPVRWRMYSLARLCRFARVSLVAKKILRFEVLQSMNPPIMRASMISVGTMAFAHVMSAILCAGACFRNLVPMEEEF